MLKKIESLIDKFANLLGSLISVVLIIMMFNVAFDTINRYVFNTNSVAMQELEWHFFSVIILLGISYGLNQETHVRVDVLYTKFSEKNKALINMFGVVLFILPISLLVAFNSFGFVAESYNLLEQSANPGGLQYRFIIKSLIPIAFFLLILTSIGYFLRNYHILQNIKQE